MRQPESIITVAADSIELLQREHIFCVFDHCLADELQSTADFITSRRPDLAAEVAYCLNISLQERYPKTSPKTTVTA